MDSLRKKVDSLLNQLKALIAVKNAPTDAGKKLYQTALSLMKPEPHDITPEDNVPDEVACAETINKLHQIAFNEPIGGGASTYWLYLALKNHKQFVQVPSPLPGDIIISYTGEQGSGKNGIKNGHVGCMATDNRIFSNSSKTGFFTNNFSLFDWNYRYKTLGGYNVYFFRRI